MAIIYLSAGNVLPMFQDKSADRPDTLKVEFFNQTLALTGVATVSQSPIKVNQALSFQQRANYNPKQYSLSSSFPVSHVVSRAAITLDVNSYLAMNDSSRTVETASASNQITFTGTVESRRSFTGRFQVTHAVGVTIVRKVPASNLIEFRSSVRLFKQHDDRFIAVTIPESVPTFLKVQLVCGSNSLQLGTPEIGNGNEIEHLRINRETRAGERIIYKDPMWPVLERFTYNFDNLNGTQAANLLEFISRTLGQMITLTDHENIVWSVQLKNPDAEVKQEGRCSYSTELEFEGARV